MSATMDTRNPAVAKNLDLPPALLEAVRDDPEQMQPLARAMAAVLANDLFIARGSMTAPQQQSLMEAFAKLGNLNPKEKVATQHGQGYQLVINIGGTQSESFKGVTVEATPALVDVESDADV